MQEELTKSAEQDKTAQKQLINDKKNNFTAFFPRSQVEYDREHCDLVNKP